MAIIALPGVQAITPPEPEAPDTGRLLDGHRADLIACLIEEISTEAHQMDGLCEIVLDEEARQGESATRAGFAAHALRQSIRRIGALADAVIRHGDAAGRARLKEGEWALPVVCRNTLAEIRKVQCTEEHV